MPSLLRHTDCPACGHRHHFCLLTDDLVPGREYAYVCPENGKKATLRPTAAAEVVDTPTQGAVQLTPVTYDSSASPRQPEASHPQPVDPGSLPEEALAGVGELEEQVTTAPPAAPLPVGATEPVASPTRLQEVLPEVKDLAGKVGGLDKLSDILETLKDAKKE